MLGLALSTSAVAAKARPTLSTTAARREIAALVASTYPDLTVGNVACPPVVVRAAGTTFTCTVQVPGTFLLVEGDQKDESGTVTLSTPQAVIDTHTLEGFVAANASITATVDCGPAWIVARPGAQLTCTAALSDGTTRTVALTVRDTAGNVTITGVR